MSVREPDAATSHRVEGYLGQLSVVASESVSVYLNSSTDQEVTLALCDLANPDRQAVAGTRTVSETARAQITRRGSFYEIELDLSEGRMVAPSTGRSVSAFIYPTVSVGQVQAVISWENSSGATTLALDEVGCLTWLSPTHSVTSAEPLELNLWHLVVVALSSGGVTIEHQPVVNACNGRYAPHLVATSPLSAHSFNSRFSNELPSSSPDLGQRAEPGSEAGSREMNATSGQAGNRPRATKDVTPDSLRIGAAGRGDRVTWAFTGKIGPIGLQDGVPDFSALLSGPTVVQAQTLSLWAPSRLTEEVEGTASSPQRDMLRDSGPNRVSLSPVNSPVASVTGPNWTGESDQPVLVPDQYCARRYDSQAVTDCEWEPAAEVVVPASCVPGIYAIRVQSVDGARHYPFVVRNARSAPGDGARKSPVGGRVFRGFGSRGPRKGTVAVVLPTMTYLAEAGRRAATVHAGAHTPLIPGVSKSTADYGGSTLDVGADGSGVCLGALLRPLPELDPDARSFDAVGPGRFAQDLGLLRFLRAQGIEVDVVTDEDLDHRGVEALEPYRVVLTGSYPAYASRKMLSAWEDYAAGGGRVMYLGGGGFYWLASFNADHTIVEVRRGESGSRTWQADPGEYDHMLEPERCGLWRTKGRAPQKVFGVGFAADGRSIGIGFERMPDSFHKAVSWVFDGVSDGLIGSPTSSSPLGAAALEADRYDRLLGSPPHSRILASATQLPEDYLKTVEEVLFNHPGLTGNQDAQVRADMVMFTTPRGGAVFSAGSSAWTLGLNDNAGNNKVARVTLNVIRAFMSSGPLIGHRFDDEDDLVAVP